MDGVDVSRQHRADVETMWAARIRAKPNRDALVLAYLVADAIPDTGEPVWFGGRTTSAVALGLIDPGDEITPSAKRAVARAVATLVEVGFLKRVSRGFPGQNAEFRVSFNGPRLPVDSVDK